MASSWSFVSDPELEAAVRDLGTRLDFPPSQQVAFVVRQRLERAKAQAPRRAVWARVALGRVLRPVMVPAWRRVAVAMLVLVAFLSGALTFSPSARRAVAGWLGLRGIKIEVTPSLSPLPTPLGRNLVLGPSVSLAEAQATVPFDILIPTAPGFTTPDEIDLIKTFATGRVSLLYEARPGLPAASQTGVGMVITEFEAEPDVSFIEKKLIPSGTVIDSVRVNGEPGFWIEGEPHELYYVGPDGLPFRDTARLAGNVLIWQHGSVTLRLEAEISKAQALAIAESVA
jgi:hypothetical protein